MLLTPKTGCKVSVHRATKRILIQAKTTIQLIPQDNMPPIKFIRLETCSTMKSRLLIQAFHQNF